MYRDECNSECVFNVCWSLLPSLYIISLQCGGYKFCCYLLQIYNHLLSSNSRRGPVVVLRMDVGILSRGHLGPAEMITEYITENQTDKVGLFNKLWDVH